MDIESVVLAFCRRLLTEFGFRLPIHVAAVAPNGSALFTRLRAAPGSARPGAVEIEHVTGNLEDEGFSTPTHLMATDATGRVKLGVQRRHGEIVVLELADDVEGEPKT